MSWLSIPHILRLLVITAACLIFATGFNPDHYLSQPTGIKLDDNTIINPTIYPAIFYSHSPITITFADQRQFQLKDERLTINLKAGWNHFQLSGHGVFPQSYKLYHYKKAFAPTYYISPRLLPRQTTPTHHNAAAITPLPTTARRPDTFASSCHKLKASSTKYGLSLLNCPYTSLSEELKTIGPYPSTVISSDTARSHHAYSAFFEQLLSLRPAFMLQVTAENLHRVTAMGTSGFEAAALSSLIAGDCHRVHQLATEINQLALSSIPLGTYQAICYELEGKETLAQTHYTQLRSKLTPHDLASAPALYHVSRWQARTSVLKAESILNECTRNYPWFYPCFARLADIAIIKGQFAQHTTFINQFRAYADSSLIKEVETVLKLITAGRLTAAQTRIQAHPLKEIAASLIWLSMYLHRSRHPTTIRTPQAYQGRMLSETAAQLVLDYLLSTRKSDFLAIELAMHIMTRDSHHYTKNHQSALLAYLYDHNRCPKALSIRFLNSNNLNSNKIQQASSSADEDIMDLKSLCYIRLKHYQKAEAQLFKMQHQFPASWRPIFRLAELYVTQGNLTKGLNTYRLTQSYLPPETIIDEINTRIKTIQASQAASTESQSL